MESSSFEQLKDLRGPILITGHSGFKGTWLTLLLQSMGIGVIGAALKPKKESLFNSVYAELDSNLGNWIDLRNLSALSNFLGDKKPSYVFHLAAQALVSEGYQDPIGTFETNVMGTANLMEAIRESKSIRGITVVTTDKVYRNRNLSNRFVEDDALEGIDPYSASKVGTEAVATAWKNIYQKDKEIAVNVVRAGNVIGGGDLSMNRLLPDLIRSVKSGTPAVIRNPDSTRPWQHVLDPLLGYLMAANLSLREKRNLTLNFGPLEGALSVSEVARLSQLKWDEISYEIQPSAELYESKYLELNATLACDLTGWRPRVNQVEAVGMTIDWWKSRALGLKSSRELCMRDINLVC